MPKTFLTIQQVAERYGVSPKVIYREAREGRLPHLRVGTKLIRFDEDDLTAWEQEQRTR